MASLTIFLILALLSFLQTCTNAQRNYDAVFFQPDVTITKMQSTLIVPSLSTGAGAHGIWPGIENDSFGFVYQNVVADNFDGQWHFFIEHCCDPNVESTPINVYPGDSITSTFTLNTGTNTWTDAWSLTPGPIGAAAGQQPQSGSMLNSFPSEGTLDKVLLALELQEGAVWDFDQVQWTNIVITALTTSTAWCSSNLASTSTTGGFRYSVSAATASISGSSVTCSYGNVLFEGPN